MAEVTTLDNLLNYLASEVNNLENIISSLKNTTKELIGEFTLASEQVEVPDGSNVPKQDGKLTTLARSIQDITDKNLQLVEITRKLSETL